MKLTKLAKEIDIAPKSITQFIHDFGLEKMGVDPKELNTSTDFETFALENTEFLQKYDEDLSQKKTLEQIAEKINQPKDLVEKAVRARNIQILDNGFFKTSVSSYGIDQSLGGNYQFVYSYFGQETALEQRDFVGYRDLFHYISEVLEPFSDPQQIKDWGISKPAGIIVYGAPGSGKIFWSKKIAEIIGYRFEEIRRHDLGSCLVDGEKKDFNDFISTKINDGKVLLFLDDFDEIMLEPTTENNLNSYSLKAQEVILHHISKFERENILMIGSALSVSKIDSELLAPGRFDVLVPVFPPNAAERAEIILHAMTKNLAEDSLLFKILKNNNADKVPFWKEIAGSMKAFSNTMMIDFTQSVRKKIKNLYQKSKDETLKIDKKLLQSALRDAAAKLTEEYLNQMSVFLMEAAIHNLEDFRGRIDELKKELETYKAVEKPRKSIGFAHNDKNNKG